MNKLTVLDSSGDFEIKWEPSDQAQIESTRHAIADLKEAGYSFFLIDGRPADEVPNRLYTFVNPDAIRCKAEPGKCFIKAGWRRTEHKSKRGNILLDKYDELGLTF